LALPFAALVYWLVDWLPAAIVLVYGLASPLAPVIARKSGSVELGANFYMSVVLASFSALIWMTGGLMSPAVIGLIVAAPVGVLTLGKRSAYFWVAVAVVEIIVLTILFLNDIAVHQVLDEQTHKIFLGLILVGFTLILFVLLLDYQSALDSQSEAIVLSQDVLTDARNEVKAATELLAASALVAMDANDGQELGARMARQSDRGRLALVDVKGLNQLVADSHQNMRPCIQRLEAQGRAIENHLHTLDRISNKLDLMSVNAALEAVHSNKHGQSFKPLAAEMRRLAALAVHEIAAIREGIAGVSREAGLVGSAAEQSAEASLATSRSLDQLSTAFDQVLLLFQESTTATAEARTLGRKQLQAIERLLR